MIALLQLGIFLYFADVQCIRDPIEKSDQILFVEGQFLNWNEVIKQDMLLGI